MAAVVMHRFSVLAAPSVRSQGTVLGGVFSMILVVIFIGGYYYLSYLVIGKKYAIYDKEGRIRLSTMEYSSSSKLRSYFKKEYQTFFRNPVYVINGLFGIFVTPFLLPLSFRISTTAESIEQIRKRGSLWRKCLCE